MRLNDSNSDNELVIRCPFCGDSNDLSHGHLKVNMITGLYFCMRCSQGGKFSTKEMLKYSSQEQLLIHNDTPLLPVPKEVVSEHDLRLGAGMPRKSFLDRYHVTFRGSLWDAFEMKYPGGSSAGVYLRTQNKISYIAGEKGVAWKGKGPLLSSFSEPIRIVEGPYDVIQKGDVCVFGAITSNILQKYFLGQYVILAPDGDVWRKTYLAQQIYKALVIAQQKGVCIIGLELFKDGKDPDEVNLQDIISIASDQISHFRDDLRHVLGVPKKSSDFGRRSTFRNVLAI